VRSIKPELIPVSIGLLYDGMVAPQDIYDSDAKLLLIRQGQTLRSSQIDAIRRFNKGRDTIQVSLETQKLLMQRKPPKKENTFQAKLEKETGYTGLKDETFAMIDEIGQTNTAPRDKIHTISLDLSDKVENTKPDLILDLINAIAPVDEYLQRHCVNVSLLNGLIGKWLGLPKETVDMLVLIGLVHDCGKLSVPPQILNAPRKLTAAEYEVIKMHPVYAYEMLSEFPDTVRYGARGHHEKYGSKGYPDSIIGNSIPLAAQITAVSDIYDAMVSQRSYKTPRNPFHIISWIKKLRGTELEQSIVDTFIENMPKEMVNKSALLSNGKVGVIHALDHEDMEHPYIRIGEKVFKSSENLFCAQMYLAGKGESDG
jgi:HD-GYP domain-containing protein (c-di-GMP phosphodiesterase class II)